MFPGRITHPAAFSFNGEAELQGAALIFRGSSGQDKMVDADRDSCVPCFGGGGLSCVFSLFPRQLTNRAMREASGKCTKVEGLTRRHTKCQVSNAGVPPGTFPWCSVSALLLNSCTIGRRYRERHLRPQLSDGVKNCNSDRETIIQ